MSISRFLFPLLLLSCLSFKAQSQQQNAERTPYHTSVVWRRIGSDGVSTVPALLAWAFRRWSAIKLLKKYPSVRVYLSFLPLNAFPDIKRLICFDTELTAFIRIRPYRGFFIQGEIGPGWGRDSLQRQW